MTNSHFYNLLEKALAKTITQDEEKELWGYIDEWESPDVEFLKFACDKKYVPAYSTLGNIYSKGELCPQDWNKAIEYWKKAAVEGDREYLRLDTCYINLGDCYRLGNGVDKDYDIAWHYYELAIEYKQERSEYPETNLLLLETDKGLDPWNMTVSNDWWEYAIEKSGNTSANICNFMSAIYDRNEERYLYWNKKASDNGNLTAKINLYDIEDNISNKKKIAREIFSFEDFNEHEATRMLIIAKEILNYCELAHDEKLTAFKFLHNSHAYEYVYNFYKDNESELEQFLFEIQE